MMYFKQITEIIEGRKTCTQRVIKPGELATVVEREIVAVRDARGRLKWQVGHDYAVSPGRGKPGAWWRFDPTYMARPRVWHLDYPDETRKTPPPASFIGDWKPLRICITKIERVRLHTTDEIVAHAEGVLSRAAYIDLWGVINGVKAWMRNPLVWRLWFEVAAEQTADGGEGA